jgi:hypothetical protein
MSLDKKALMFVLFSKVLIVTDIPIPFAIVNN